MNKKERNSRARQWKRKVYENIAFPSGAEADIKRPRMTALITQDGNIPNSLFGILFDGGNQKQQKLNKMKAEEQADYMKTMMYLADQVAVAAFVSPQIVTAGEADYEADEIHLDDLEDEDKQFLLDWAMSGGEPEAALKRFLAAQQAANLDVT